MKKSDLKKVLKPIILECFKEFIFEENVLSTIINEAIKVKSEVLLENKRYFSSENKQQTKTNSEQIIEENLNKKEKQQLEIAKQKLLSSNKLSPFNKIFESFSEDDLQEKTPIDMELEQTDSVRDFIKESVNKDLMKEILEKENNKKVQFADEPSIKHQIYSNKNKQEKQKMSVVPQRDFNYPESARGTLGEFFDPKKR